MKKAFLLIVACTFAFVSAYAQNSEVEVASQLTKAEQFKANNSFIKEAEIYKLNAALKVSAKLFTDLKSGEQLVALEFQPTTLTKALGGALAQPLGYLDMDQVDDFILALEKISNEFNAADKEDNFTITYTAHGGIDVVFSTGAIPGQVEKNLVWLRKKWFKTDEYGVKTSVYSEASAYIHAKGLPQFISSLKEAQAVATQYMK